MKLYPVYVGVCPHRGKLVAFAATVPGMPWWADNEADALAGVAKDIAERLGAGVVPQPAPKMEAGEWLRWVQVEEPQADLPHGPLGLGLPDDLPGKVLSLPSGVTLSPDMAVVGVLAERLAAVEAKVEALASAGATAFPHLEAVMRAEGLTLSADAVDEDEWRAQLIRPGGNLAMVGQKVMRRYGVTAAHAVARLEQLAAALAKEQEGKAS